MNPENHVLLLDVDGVLIKPPTFFHAQFMNAHRQTLTNFFNGPFMSASTGKSDIREHLPDLLDALGRTETIEEYLKAWCDHENHVDQELVDAVKSLRAQGWRVYLATNQEEYRVRHLLNESRLDAIVDGEYASYTVGYRKPDIQYYNEVTRRLGVNPKSIVFWDDLSENVEAAREAGWQGRLYQNVEGFRREMNQQIPEQNPGE
jgi:putative hydrolase of the HAD superfamily